MTTLPVVQLSDYHPPAWTIHHVDLTFVLASDVTTVTAKTQISPRGTQDTLVLDGEDLRIQSIVIDGVVWEDFTTTASDITLKQLPSKAFELTVITEIYPEKNTRLEGLYQSNGNYCTQCEAEGFRRITYFLDRPDVLTTYTTTIVADKEKYPVLLGNGNLVSHTDLAGGQHQSVWHDPVPKPCYLFALVAGNLVALSDTFTTQSNRVVDLHIYVESHNLHLCDYAMHSLKQAMRWDEQEYGREYDLDVFHIVAVDDFNMGAMENKSLNVFNSKYILADMNTATDTDFINVQAVVAHEYFHNWTGNRITCRDWFQLSLKEGLTVFRDQEFTADMHSRTVKRIADVRLLRTHQFAEDASGLAHPVRPAQYVEINNFYTLTVYEKGAEIIRMCYHLLGKKAWRVAMDLYFDTFDGQAVTVEDLLACVSKAADKDYSVMMAWYTQKGTPQVQAQWHYADNAWQLQLQQSGLFEDYQPLLIPVEMAWVDAQSGENTQTQVLHFDKAEQIFHFAGLPETMVPSLLQQFSAPVSLHAEYSTAALAVLVQHDQDLFNRWQALQNWFAKVVFAQEPVTPLAEVLADLVQDETQDFAWLAEMLTLPSIHSLVETMASLDIDFLWTRYQTTVKELAKALSPVLLARYQKLHAANDLSAQAMATRSLRNALLVLLSQGADTAKLSQAHYRQAENMTDKVAGLRAALHLGVADALLDDFYKHYHTQNLAVDKWFALQVSCERAETFSVIETLLAHPDFNWKNPNRLRAVLSVLSQNFPVFHRGDGAAYRLLGHWVEKVDGVNPQIAARLAKAFSCLPKLQSPHKEQLQAEIARLSALKLSKDVSEILQLL